MFNIANIALKKLRIRSENYEKEDIKYSYDEFGNVIKRTLYGSTISYTYIIIEKIEWRIINEYFSFFKR